MILRWAHHILIALYCAAPIVAVALALLRYRRTGRSGGSGIAFTISAAIVMGSALSLALTISVGAHIRIEQIALTVYLLAALMFVLRGFDASMVWCLRRALGSTTAPAADDATEKPPRESFARRVAVPLSFFVRAALLVFVGIPYLIAVTLVYRPKVVARGDPQSLLNVAFEDVRFETDDGVTLAGWWIRAPARASANRDAEVRETRARGGTVIMCHGFASGKTGTLKLAQPLLNAGYNVLTFDFRAHGQSGGQLTSLGANERLDVLAAVRWLQTARPKQARRIVGVGVSSGAAALIAAAADPSPQGQAIEAVAALEVYDSLPGLARTVTRDRFLPPLSWVTDRVALAIASAHVGADMLHFTPADHVKELWPRPLLVIHGAMDMVVPFEHGERLYEAADEPRRRVWLSMHDYVRALEDKAAANEVRLFFDEARPVSAI